VIFWLWQRVVEILLLEKMADGLQGWAAANSEKTKYNGRNMLPRLKQKFFKIKYLPLMYWEFLII
jgi:hypothetical protein